MAVLEAAALVYFDEQPQLALLLDGNAHVVRVSDRLRKYMGIPESVTLAGPLSNLVSPGRHEPLRLGLDAIREPGSETSILLSMVYEGQTSPSIAWRFSRSRDGKTIHAVALEPEEKQTGRVVASDLGRKVDFLQRIIDTMPVVVWAVDDNAIFTLSDGAALATLGLQPGQVVGMNSLELYAAEPAIVEAIRDGLAGKFTCHIVSGSGFMWESRYIPIVADDGRVTGVVGFSLDVTERVQAEKELRQQLELVEQQETAIRSLSTPIMRVWDGVLALPLVGMLDATRIERILEALLEAVVHDQAEYVIIDLTGISDVDDTAADYIFKVLRALALLGTQAVVTGIRPAVARALVELGLDLGQVVTLGNLEEAIRLVMKRRNTRTK
ncbi:MAG TPA: PAS domain-containing protein [Polyangium sp.]|nr:PAS domain-containing protein [Polyangium sp.]